MRRLQLAFLAVVALSCGGASVATNVGSGSDPEPLSRLRFNQLALRLDLPLFWVEDTDGERLVAWFEPEHHVLEAASPFFARRFANLRWTILSPRVSMHWDGVRLCAGPGARRETAPPPDAGAALWLTYYRSIFNPARLKLAMMTREMPRRYWANLPEAALIEPLVAQADGRVRDMLDAGPTAPRRIRPIALPRRADGHRSDGHRDDGKGGNEACCEAAPLDDVTPVTPMSGRADARRR